MSYAELPLEDRIGQASEYALLLIEDSVLEEDVIKRLQETFALTEEQAMEALLKTRTEYSKEFRLLQKQSISRAIFL